MTSRLTPGDVIDALEQSGVALTARIESTPESAVSWVPGAGRWSILEIVCHLVDEERLDFRTRTRGTIERPEEPWEPIDPVGWATLHRYAEQDFGERLRRFGAERRASVEWLRGIEDSSWDRTYMHPEWGPVRARLLLDNWLAHDHLHARQVLANQYQWLVTGSAESLRYAGDW